MLISGVMYKTSNISGNRKISDCQYIIHVSNSNIYIYIIKAFMKLESIFVIFMYRHFQIVTAKAIGPFLDGDKCHIRKLLQQ